MPNEINIDIDAPGFVAGEGSEPEEEKTRRDNLVMNPLTGVLVDLDDADSVILACDDARKQLSDLRDFDRMLRHRASEMAQGSSKTRRLRGKKYQATVTAGDRYPDQSILKQAWQSYPQYRDEYLRLGSVYPRRRETKKLRDMTSDDKSFESFRTMVLAGEDAGTDGMPTVRLEKELDS